MDFYTNIEEAILFDYLKYLPEMDEFYDTTHSLLNLPSSDDNPLSYVWLKIHKMKIQNQVNYAMTLVQNFTKRILLMGN